MSVGQKQESAKRRTRRKRRRRRRRRRIGFYHLLPPSWTVYWTIRVAVFLHVRLVVQ
jgi:hypothetical protein